MSAPIRKRQTGPRSIALAWTNDSNSQTGDGIIRYELADYEWIAIKPMLPGQNYLIPVDGKIWNEEDVRRQGVSIVFEASRRNPYERRFGTYSHGLVPIQTSENALIPSSAAPDQVVEDPDELHSHRSSYANGFFEGDRQGLQQHPKRSEGCYSGPTDSSCVI